MSCSHRCHRNRLAGCAATSWSSSDRCTPRLCQLPVSSCVNSLCLPTEIRNEINSFSLSTGKIGFLGLPPAKKWVLYGETWSGLGRPQTVPFTGLAAGGDLCSPVYLQGQRSLCTPRCPRSWGGGCSNQRLSPQCTTFAALILQLPCRQRLQRRPVSITSAAFAWDRGKG